jgi:alpha-mannosidase
VTQDITVAPGERRVDVEARIDWHEQDKILKCSFPLAIHAERAASETQFGHIFRPTHTNTSWEFAKFETAAHRFVHVAEEGYGAAIVNDSTYGYDISRSSADDGATTTTVRLSLLRGPQFPDPVADQGPHTLRYSLVVGAAINDAVQQGYHINLPVRTVVGADDVQPLVKVDNPSVVLSTVKMADDQSGDVVVRVYEAGGGHANAAVTPTFGATSVVSTDLLERPWEDSSVELADGSVALSLRPFQIVTLRFTR